MDRTKRRIEITVEKHRLIFMSHRKVSVLAWCGTCCGRVRMLTPEQAAQLTGVTPRTIYRRLEGGQIHFMETAEGVLMICSASLQDSI